MTLYFFSSRSACMVPVLGVDCKEWLIGKLLIKKLTNQVPFQAVIVKFLWLSLYLGWYFNPEFDGNLGRTEIENKRCGEMPRVLAYGFWYWRWDWGCGSHQCRYMSSCLCCSHVPTFQCNRRGCVGITWRSFFVSFKCQLSLWRLVKHKMTVSPGHALLSSNMRPPDVLWFQFTGCSLSGGQCTSFGVFFFVLMHLARKGGSQCTDLTWTWDIVLRNKDPPISHSVFSSWEE